MHDPFEQVPFWPPVVHGVPSADALHSLVLTFGWQDRHSLPGVDPAGTVTSPIMQPSAHRWSAPQAYPGQQEPASAPWQMPLVRQLEAASMLCASVPASG